VEKWSESTWESGKRAPSLETYRIVANFFFYLYMVGRSVTDGKKKKFRLSTDTLVGNNFYFDFRFFFFSRR
jgi:hypothetical protein